MTKKVRTVLIRRFHDCMFPFLTKGYKSKKRTAGTRRWPCRVPLPKEKELFVGPFTVLVT